MTREEAIQHFKEQLDIFGGEHAEAIKVAIEALAVYPRFKWERDTAISQLEEYGIGFAEKKRDLVEVVRCKDCKWYEQKQKNLPYAVKKSYCNRSCTLATKEDDFCSYGERSEE